MNYPRNEIELFRNSSVEHANTLRFIPQTIHENKINLSNCSCEAAQMHRGGLGAVAALRAQSTLALLRHVATLNAQHWSHLNKHGQVLSAMIRR